MPPNSVQPPASLGQRFLLIEIQHGQENTPRLESIPKSSHVGKKTVRKVSGQVGEIFAYMSLDTQDNCL